MPISPFLFILLIYGTLRSFVAEQQNDDYWNASIISIRFFTFLSFVYTDQALFVSPCKNIHVIKLVLCTHVLWFSTIGQIFWGLKYLFWIFHSDSQYLYIALLIQCNVKCYELKRALYMKTKLFHFIKNVAKIKNLIFFIIKTKFDQIKAVICHRYMLRVNGSSSKCNYAKT